MSMAFTLPALLAAAASAANTAVPDSGPKFSIAPFSRVTLEFGSDRLAFAPSDADRFARAADGQEVDYLSPLLRRSFPLEGLDPGKTSEVLSRELADGVRIWASAHSTWLDAAWKRTRIAIGTDAAAEVRLPGAPFLLLFSPDRGLQSGRTLDFSGFRQDFRWTSHFRASREFPGSPPPFLAKWGGFDRFVATAGAGYYMGHALLIAEMDEGTVKSDGAAALLAVDGRMRIRSAGLGLEGKAVDPGMEPFRQVAAGHGAGVSLGAKLESDRHSLDLRIEDAGAIVWGRTRNGTIQVREDSLTVTDFIKGLRPPGAEPARPDPFEEPGDSIRAGGALVTPLPASFTAVYARAWRLGGLPARWTLDRIVAEGSWRQALAPGPGTGFVPTLGAVLVQPWLGGRLPFRLGWTLGGAERYAATMGLGLRLSRFSFAADWTSFGSFHPVPRRGFRFGWSLWAGW